MSRGRPNPSKTKREYVLNLYSGLPWIIYPDAVSMQAVSQPSNIVENLASRYIYNRGTVIHNKALGKLRIRSDALCIERKQIFCKQRGVVDLERPSRRFTANLRKIFPCPGLFQQPALSSCSRHFQSLVPTRRQSIIISGGLLNPLLQLRDSGSQ